MRPHSIATILVLFLLYGFCTANLQVVAEEVPALVAAAVREAKALVERGHHDQAISRLNTEISLHDDSGILFLTRGLSYQSSDRDKEAVQDFTRAIELGFRAQFAHVSRGLSRLTLDDRAGAVADFDQATRLAPDNATAYLLRARALYETGKIAKALEDFDKAVQLDPNAEAFVGRAFCHLKLNDYAAACSDATRAAKLDASNPSPIWIRMSAHLERGDREAAESDYRLARSLEAAKLQ